METKAAILKRLDDACRKMRLNDFGVIRWEHGQRIRAIALDAKRNDPNAWPAFLAMLRDDRELAGEFRQLLDELGIVRYSGHRNEATVTPPEGTSPLSPGDEDSLLDVLDPLARSAEISIDHADSRLGDVMYIEWKPGITGHARIGRVQKSGSGKTFYYRGYTLTSLKGTGYKANYIDAESGMEFWVSNCRKDGNDTLYPGTIEIDADAREEYWTVIRRKPENVGVARIRSAGKYSKRRPS